MIIFKNNAKIIVSLCMILSALYDLNVECLFFYVSEMITLTMTS